MDIGYMLYQAERAKTSSEQREIDNRSGELAATVARWLRALGTSRRAAQPRGPGGLTTRVPAGTLCSRGTEIV